MLHRAKFICHFFSALFGRRKLHSDISPSIPTSFPVARSSIFVRKGTLPGVRRAIEQHATIARHILPGKFAVQLFKQSDDAVFIHFPDGLPAYELVNLIGWLDQPPGIGAVSDAMGWITSPASKTRYVLFPDESNDAGDTLIGASERGQAVRVYLPDAALCEISSDFTYTPEPSIINVDSSADLEFSIQADCDVSFGNPLFVVTHTKDTD